MDNSITFVFSIFPFLFILDKNIKSNRMKKTIGKRKLNRNNEFIVSQWWFHTIIDLILMTGVTEELIWFQSLNTTSIHYMVSHIYTNNSDNIIYTFRFFFPLSGDFIHHLLGICYLLHLLCTIVSDIGAVLENLSNSTKTDSSSSSTHDGVRKQQ